MTRTPQRSAYWFVAPLVAVLAIFFVWPLYRSLILSFHTTAGPHTSRYVGLGNYRFLIGHDRIFWLAVANTLAYTLGFVMIQLPASLGLAMLMNHRAIRLKSLLRLCFFSTYLVGQVFVAIIFFALLGRQRDVLNNPNLVLPATLAAGLWLSIGYGMIYFLAALAAVDVNLYETAILDGAGAWEAFWHVTLPAIKPVMVFLLVVGTIAGFQLFELPFILLQGPGPGYRGLTIVMYLYSTAFERGDLGYSAAIGWLLVLLLGGVSMLQLKFTNALGGIDRVKGKLIQFAVILLALVNLTPFLWLVCAAFKTPDDTFEYFLLPWGKLSHLTLANFTALFDQQPFARWMVNSIFLACTYTVSVVVLSSLAGFSLAKHRFAGRRVLMVVMLAVMLLPSQVILVSLYELMGRFGWLNSYLAILVPGAVSVFGAFLFRQAMQSVPDELLQSARLDGCGELRVWWEIALPLGRPTVGAFTLMSFLSSWSGFLWPQIVLQDEARYTLPLGLNNMVGLQSYQGQYGLLAAGTLLGLIPVILLFFAVQSDFMAGLIGRKR